MLSSLYMLFFVLFLYSLRFANIVNIDMIVDMILIGLKMVLTKIFLREENLWTSICIKMK